MYEVNGIDRVNAKVDALTQKIESLDITPVATVAAITPNCELYGSSGNIMLIVSYWMVFPTTK